MSIQRVGSNDPSFHSAEIEKSAAAKAAEPTRATRRAQAPRDEVSLSSEARSLAAARDSVAAASDVREDKVSAIKQRVEDGTYSVPSNVLARKLLDSHQG